MDQHRAAAHGAVGAGVLVVVQTVETKPAQLGGAPADPGQQFDGGPPRAAGQRLEGGEILRVEQRVEHPLGQRPPDVLLFVVARRPVTPTQRDLVGQAGERAAGAGQTHRAGFAQETRQRAHHLVAAVAGQGAGGLQPGESGQERLHVGPVQGTRRRAVVGAAGQMLREQADRGEHGTHRGRCGRGEGVRRP